MTDNTLDKEIDEILDKLLRSLYCMDDKDHNLEQPEIDYDKAKSKLKSLIADREKKMLEFVIGEDLKINPILDADFAMEEAVKGSRILTPAKIKSICNNLKSEQRQRAKEWSKR